MITDESILEAQSELTDQPFYADKHIGRREILAVLNRLLENEPDYRYEHDDAKFRCFDIRYRAP